MNLYEAIGCRRSVRRYSSRPVPEEIQKNILRFLESASRLYESVQVEAEILDNTRKKAPVKGLFKAEAPYYLAFYSEMAEGCERNAGYMLEQTALYMLDKGLGSCFLGSARPARMMKNGKKFIIMLAFGYPEGRLVRESPLAVRLPLRRLCTFRDEPTENVRILLRAARLAPSAMNRQPWRFVVSTGRIYVYQVHDKWNPMVSAGMQEIDMGIMLSHIMLAADELWIQMETRFEEPRGLSSLVRGKYVVTLILL